MNVVITYDVRDDRRRAHVAAKLAKVGVRIQRSVFQCVLDAGALSDLMLECEKIVDMDVDVVQAFVICESCRRLHVSVGQANVALEEAFWVV